MSYSKILWNLQQQIRLSHIKAIGASLISISQLRNFKRLETNCLQTATTPQGGTEKWPRTHSCGPTMDTRISVPCPPRGNGNTQHENTVTPKSARHCSDHFAAAPRKWKYTLNHHLHMTRGDNMNGMGILVGCWPAHSNGLLAGRTLWKINIIPL